MFPFKSMTSSQLIIIGNLYFPNFKQAFILLLILFSNISLFAETGNLKIGNEAYYSLSDSFTYFEDPSKKITIEDIQSSNPNITFLELGKIFPSSNFGNSHSAFWLRIQLDLDKQAEEYWLLEIAYPVLDLIEIYYTDSKGILNKQVSGDLLPFSERSVPHRNHVFPLNLKSGLPTTIYLRVSSEGAITIPAKLWKPKALGLQDQKEYSFLSMYFGLVLGLLIYNLLLYFSIRERSYLYYVAFAIFMGLTQVSLSGMGNQFLWSDYIWWGSHSAVIGMVISGVFALLFAKEFLSTVSISPLLNKLYLGMIFFLVLNLIAVIFLSYGFAGRMISVIALVAIPLLIVTAVISLRRNHPGAKYFLIAWASLLLGAFVLTIHNNGYLPSSIITLNSLLIGSAIEMILLAFALADRYNTIRREKEKAQAEVLLSQEQLVINLQTSERLLEERVYARTSSLSQSNLALSKANSELIENKVELERLSVTDRLTGLYNRLMLDRVIEDELHRSKRYGQVFSVILLDIDHFKSVNDTYGHLIGDQVLVGIASLISSGTRDTDVLGRWGGEEFLIICRDTGLQGAEIVAEKLRQTVAKHSFPDVGTKTCSFGVSAATGIDTIEFLLARVDKGLYRAKEAGRNRVETEI